ncbi:MAG: hypothetical protein QOG11_1802 [Solirubrobacteraceae bacterium]|jgi:hypothetical protein|nr:hypothetical protein [Solirubrobacteraceae bacterium]
MSPTYLSLDAFYASDQRRAASGEVDTGLWWSGLGNHAPTFRAAWVQATGELYVMQHAGTLGGGRVDVIAEVADEEALAARLAGWHRVCGEPGSLGWLLQRADRVPSHLRRAAAPPAGPRPQRRGPVRPLDPIGAA